jgi:hypothetical protein
LSFLILTAILVSICQSNCYSILNLKLFFLNKCTKSEEPVVEDEEDDDEDDDDEDDKDEDDAEGDFVTSVNFHFLFS